MLVKIVRGTREQPESETYQCRHVDVGIYDPRSVACSSLGHQPGIVVEVVGATSVTHVKFIGGKRRFTNDKLDPAELVRLALPDDGDVIFIMNDEKKTMKTLRWPPPGVPVEDEGKEQEIE